MGHQSRENVLVEHLRMAVDLHDDDHVVKVGNAALQLVAVAQESCDLCSVLA